MFRWKYQYNLLYMFATLAFLPFTLMKCISGVKDISYFC